MNIELASTAIACGCIGLLSAVALKRRVILTPDRLGVVATKRRLGTGSPGQAGRVARRDVAADAARVRDGSLVAVEPSADHPWFDVDLFPAVGGEPGARFDDTVALPIDTPRRLDTAIHAASTRLDALPDSRDLSHRTVAYRARLKQIVRESARARRRLDDGTYGQCLTCEAPISLALLLERPWRRVCVHCALDI